MAFDGSTTSDVIAGILKDEPAPPHEVRARHAAGSGAHHRARRYARTATPDISRRQELLTDLQNFKREMAFQAKLQGRLRHLGQELD